MKKKISICILLFLSCIFLYTKRQAHFEQISSSILYNIQLGTIMLPNQKTLTIVEGTNLKVLDQKVVGHVEESSLSPAETIILAGHNEEAVFGSLKEMKRGDEVVLTLQENRNTYVVTHNIEIDQNDFSYFGQMPNTLILITCSSDFGKRRIILLKRVV